LRKGEKSALFCTGLQLQCRDGNAFILIVSTIEFESTNGCVSQILSDLLHSPVKILLFFIANQPGIRGICCILITNQHPCSDIPKHATAASAKIYPTFFLFNLRKFHQDRTFFSDRLVYCFKSFARLFFLPNLLRDRSSSYY